MDITAILNAEQRSKMHTAVDPTARHSISSEQNHELNFDHLIVKSIQESEQTGNDQSSHKLNDSYKTIEKELNADNSSRRIQFTMDHNSGCLAIRVIDAKTEEIIQEIPPEEVLQMMENIRRYNGSFFDNRA